jgi:hypothetical protein
MAQFCQAFGMSPTEYRRLTMIEFREFLKVLEKVSEQ